MRNLKIATWDVGNSKFELDKNDKKIDSVINMLIFGSLDVLVLQEVNPLLSSKIEERLIGLKGEYAITTPVKKCLIPINNLRVEKAKDLLETSNLTIDEIYELVGFSNKQTFFRVFKSITGVTPGDFKKQN